METNKNTILTLYNLLGVNRKIDDPLARIRYLRDVWGLDQSVIAKCEEMSQSSISKLLMESRLNHYEYYMEYEPAEIELLQKLPRELIQDVPLIAFVNNILQLNPNHSFYLGFASNSNLRITALSSLGIQHKKLQHMFNKSQAHISMIVKRNIERTLKLERSQRYELYIPLTFSTLPFGGKAYEMD